MGADSVGYAPGALISGSKFTMAMSPRISVSCNINWITVSWRAGVETPQGTRARMSSGIDACPKGVRPGAAEPGDRVAYAAAAALSDYYRLAARECCGPLTRAGAQDALVPSLAP